MKQKLPAETPVYLFLGFLESGKTKFIQETFEDPRFSSGEKTLLLVCEEGIEEYETIKFVGGEDVELVVIDEAEQLTEEYLTELQLKYGSDRVVVEYNGMWALEDFFKAMPEGWMINQIMTFFDSNTFLNYNANMRQLVFDKIQNTQLVVFNRFDNTMDKMAFHKIVRAISRRCDIVYEHVDGKADFDDIEDPLPFDIEAPIVEISERDYAVWYRDMAEDIKKYENKIIKVKGMTVRDEMLKKNEFAFGRMVMTCCADDTSFHGVLTVSDKDVECQNGQWFTVVARLKKEKHKMYKGAGPVFHLISMEKSEAPEDPIATFD